MGIGDACEIERQSTSAAWKWQKAKVLPPILVRHIVHLERINVFACGRLLLYDSLRFPITCMSTYLDNLHWRYATKTFDPSKKVSQAQLDDLLEALRLSASSYGLQPYRCIVITDPVLRTKISEHAWNQPQITSASHLIAICARRTLDEAYVEAYVSEIARQRGASIESLKGFRDMMIGFVQGRTSEQLAEWMKRQAYIALGFLLSAAAQMRIDACPMEGFDAEHVDRDLDLLERNLTTVALCPVGFRAADDPLAAQKKVRLSKEQFFLHVSPIAFEETQNR